MELQEATAARSYLRAREATSTPGPETEASGWGRLAENFAESLVRHEETARAAMVGGADPHALVEALSSSRLAVETVVTLRDKVVEAYQEILRMPV